MARALILAAMIAALLVVAGGFALARGSAPIAEAVPGPSSPNQMALDADADMPGVQSTRSVVGTGVFQVQVHVTQIAQPYRGYQWYLDVPFGIGFGANPTENTAATGLLGCVYFPDLGPSPYGGGCIGESGQSSSHIGPVTTFDMHCNANGTHTVALVDSATTSLSLLYSQSGAAVDTGTSGMTITCSGVTGVPTLTPVPTQTPFPPVEFGQAAMAFDANAALPGVQASSTVFGSSPFLAAIYITHLGAVPWEYYQWEFSIDPGGLDYVEGSIIEHKLLTNTALCASINIEPDLLNPPNVTIGGGCITTANEVSTFVGQVNTFQMSCVSDGVFTIHLVGIPEDANFGTTLSDTNIQPTLLQDATITCHVSATSTPTPTDTNTPTITPSPTPTRTPLPEDSAAKGIIEPFDADPLENVWLCKTNGGAPSVECGTADVFELIRAPNDRDTCNDDDDDHGQGCTPSWKGVR
jgi:hypothetical protein